MRNSSITPPHFIATCVKGQSKSNAVCAKTHRVVGVVAEGPKGLTQGLTVGLGAFIGAPFLCWLVDYLQARPL